jgi:hypothetical protein
MIRIEIEIFKRVTALCFCRISFPLGNGPFPCPGFSLRFPQCGCVQGMALYLSMLLRGSNGLHDTYNMHTIFPEVAPSYLRLWVVESTKWCVSRDSVPVPWCSSGYGMCHSIFNDPYSDVGYYHRSYNLQFRGPQDRTLPYLLFICTWIRRASILYRTDGLQTAVITNSNVVSGLRLVARGWDGNALLWHASFLGFIFPSFCLLILIDWIWWDLRCHWTVSWWLY